MGAPTRADRLDEEFRTHTYRSTEALRVRVDKRVDRLSESYVICVLR